MEFITWDRTKEIKLLDCPFCGSEPKVKHIGNDHTKKRSVEMKCTNSKCRISRRDSALTQDFAWLEEVAARNWNRRP